MVQLKSSTFSAFLQRKHQSPKTKTRKNFRENIIFVEYCPTFFMGIFFSLVSKIFIRKELLHRDFAESLDWRTNCMIFANTEFCEFLKIPKRLFFAKLKNAFHWNQGLLRESAQNSFQIKPGQAKGIPFQYSSNLMSLWYIK
jgi:hypothetical protein